MSLNSNRWNRIRYTFYTPIYDLLVGKIFTSSRRSSIDLLQIKPNEKVLLVGAGTGLDFQFLPRQAQVYAGDITPSMVAKMEHRARELKLNATIDVMDGQNLQFPDNTFDKIILHLIVAVIPDPVKCLQEVERVLKPGGEAVIFDKFRPKNQRLSSLRAFFNKLTSFLFSDITRVIETLLSYTNLKIRKDIPANFNGNFRIILVKKPV
ncbi:class I SAM-dependent methyltransferase [Adhaeribacter sp. BT258]|uniref:Class I SAM-dependent methyltransferase n=1 Tax=Adhaeribacter terrigena TaxID=2793070 RepID=A0ABS1C5W8_9BACT|nr:class I SAM-dependent methyltransferase [Adhaeribacter terrigena]MBK0403955.1 class I SAM-dependent methyltransferase [Adhaeribacter terrigena]